MIRRSLRIAGIVLLSFIAIIGIIMFASSFLTQNVRIKGESMYPSFHTGDYVTVQTKSYRSGDFNRGDVIVFWPPGEAEALYMKRAIGLPREVVRIRAGEVWIGKIDGELTQLSEEYISGVTLGYAYVVLGPDEYFLLGDNRFESVDSRYFGHITRDRIIGRALFRYWPINDFTIVKRPSY